MPVKVVLLLYCVTTGDSHYETLRIFGMFLRQQLVSRFQAFVACRHKCQAVDPIFQMCFNRLSSSFPARCEVVAKFKYLGRDPVSLAEHFLALRRVLVFSSLWSVSPRRTKSKALRFFETSVNTLTASLVIFAYKIVTKTGAQIACSRSPWPVCFVPQYGTCFNSPFWRPEV